MYQLLPDLSPEDYAALKKDIRERGVMVPVEYDQDGNIIDGHHRVRICGELGIADFPRVVRSYDDERARRTQARALNIARRHLDTAAKRALIEAELRDRPEVSNRAIAADLGVDDKTVGSVRSQLEAVAEIPQLPTTVAKDGKTRVKPSKPRLAAAVLPGVEPSGSDRDVLERAKAIRASAVASRILKGRSDYEARKSAGGHVDDLAEMAKSGLKFQVIYADPPWKFNVYSGKGKERSAERHYDTMSLSQLQDLPIAQLADEDCALFLWVVSPELPGALELINAWGFEYKTIGFAWMKQNRSGQGLFTGMGYWTRANVELCLLAARGHPVRLAMDVPQAVLSPVRQHSRKPDDIVPRIERLLAGPYLELFARQPRQGWTTWGNEVAPAEAAE